jgi:hypothetical protein
VSSTNSSTDTDAAFVRGVKPLRSMTDPRGRGVYVFMSFGGGFMAQRGVRKSVLCVDEVDANGRDW